MQIRLTVTKKKYKHPVIIEIVLLNHTSLLYNVLLILQIFEILDSFINWLEKNALLISRCIIVIQICYAFREKNSGCTRWKTFKNIYNNQLADLSCICFRDHLIHRNENKLTWCWLFFSKTYTEIKTKYLKNKFRVCWFSFVRKSKLWEFLMNNNGDC